MADIVFNTRQLIDCVKEIHLRYGEDYFDGPYPLLADEAIFIVRNAVENRFAYTGGCLPDDLMARSSQLHNLAYWNPAEIKSWDDFYQWMEQNGLNAVVLDNTAEGVPNFFLYNGNGQPV